MAVKFWSGLEGCVLKTKRDYRVAAAVLGHEVACIMFAVDAGRGGSKSDYLTGADLARESHAAFMAAQAAHYARRGATTLVHPDESEGRP